MAKNPVTLFSKDLRTLRSVLWLRPAAYCVLAALAAITIAAVDQFLPADVFYWLPEIDASIVRDLLQLLAGSMLTITTVTMSVLMLVLSIATGQASPRAVPELMADPVTQNALGTFLANFVFSLATLLLLGLGVIAGPGITLAFLFATLLVVAALRYLVQWIHHVADTVKINRVIERVCTQAHNVLESFLERAQNEDSVGDAPPRIEGAAVMAQSAGYVQFIDEVAAAELAKSDGLRIAFLVAEGDFVHSARAMANVGGGETESGDAAKKVCGIVTIGHDRSPEGDPVLGFELLAEIASRALSPGINDPQSALICLHYAGSLLARAAQVAPAEFPPPHLANGRVTVIRPTFEAMLIRSVRPVARDGAAMAEVLSAIMDLLMDLAEIAAPDYLDAITEEASRCQDLGQSRLLLEQDRKSLRETGEALGEKIQERRQAGGR